MHEIFTQAICEKTISPNCVSVSTNDTSSLLDSCGMGCTSGVCSSAMSMPKKGNEAEHMQRNMQELTN